MLHKEVESSFIEVINQIKKILKNHLIYLISAISQTNDVVEIPHLSSLSINNQEMISEEIKFENITSNILQLKKCKIIEQGKIKFPQIFYDSKQLNNLKLQSTQSFKLYLFNFYRQIKSSILIFNYINFLYQRLPTCIFRNLSQYDTNYLSIVKKISVPKVIIYF
ncbi:unnamed protein product [Paramecium sonneborni]|uniref:Uncharacterized protein n=1 Tax=Paramecium sonneborni TaxID=65129 RepID=A0A8S1RSL1_9CILI|nr:unnamed protein product [Paramecium sonneborni]